MSSGRCVADVVPAEPLVWVAGEQAQRIYGAGVDPGWDGELRIERRDGVIEDLEQ
ncbi:hypothetical protein PDG61_20650 [Mycolicibacterium sp. BiH015]|uniref:hypothetical protein n=1 Tax=Mycolicibacterium sp. BiH015 TaxID=3018808 RepID=UPI0022E7963F|nr:hypothetical protein [Mycolicibacterium sp. BiH015]MDA2893338.1 hypothetical protein [Mycolicibacterium sp. BiH015]